MCFGWCEEEVLENQKHHPHVQQGQKNLLEREPLGTLTEGQNHSTKNTN